MQAHGRSVRVQLAFVVLIVAVPLAALIAFLLYDTARRDEASAAGLAMQMAVTTADRTERYVETTRRALEAVTKRPHVREMDPQHCDPQLADLRELHGYLANIVVIDLDGRIICSANKLPAGIVRTGDPALLEAMVAKPRFRISRPFLGSVSKRWTVAMAQPVYGMNEKLAGIVAMGIDLQNWVSFSSMTGQPKGTVHDIVTTEGVIIGRSTEAADWVGRSAAASDIHKRMLERMSGTARALGTDGADRLWGFTPVPGTDWFARSSVSANRVVGPVRERVVEMTFLFTVVMAVALVAVYAVVSRLVRPMQKISEAVAARSAGALDVRVPVGGPREVAELAAELNRAIEAGERRDEHLRRFRAAMDLSGDAILLVDRATMKYVDVNQTFCELLGYSREEVLRMTPMDIFSADRATLERDYDALKEGDASAQVIEGVYLRKDGSTVPVEARRRMVRTEQGWVMVGTATDITERKAAEASLKASEERFRQTFDLAGSGVGLIGMDRRFLRVNRRLCEILGYPEAELLKVTGRQISHPDDLDVINEKRPLLYAGDLEAIRLEKRYVRKDGATIWVMLTITLQRNASGSPSTRSPSTRTSPRKSWRKRSSRRRTTSWRAPTPSSSSSPTSPRTTCRSRCAWWRATRSCCSGATRTSSRATRRSSWPSSSTAPRA